MRRMTSILSDLCKIDVESTRSNGKVELISMEEVKIQ